MQKYPALNEYNAAVQNPRLAFSDSGLKAGAVATTGLGLPRALGGGFAITYTVDSGRRKFAVRCFHKSAPALEDKYRRISAALGADTSGYFVGFEYQPNGVLVNGTRYPIVKMDWAEGKTLGSWLEKSASDHTAVVTLRRQFSELEAYLRKMKFAHGDLQNGNVILGARLKLIDYDGIYVSGLPTGQGAELGHKHFQHPLRSMQDFGPDIDRFSFVLIDLSLRALAERPNLFAKYSNGENILFTAADTKEPSQSPLFDELQKIASLKQDTENFARICAAPVAQVPLLGDFLAGKNIPAAMLRISTKQPNQPVGPSPYIGAYDVVDAKDIGALMLRVGDRVELIGCIEEVRIGKTKYKKPYIFLNFGDWKSTQAKVNIWSEAIALLPSPPTKSWVGKWISITGLVDTPYRNRKNGARHLSITVTEANQLRLLDSVEAKRRLVGPKAQSRSASKATSSNEDILVGLGVKPQSVGGFKSSGGASAANNNKKILATMGGASISSRPTTYATSMPAQLYTPPPAAGTNAKRLYWLAAAAIILIVLVGNIRTQAPSQSVSSPPTRRTFQDVPRPSSTPPVLMQKPDPTPQRPVTTWETSPSGQLNPTLPPIRPDPWRTGTIGSTSSPTLPTANDPDRQAQPLPPPVAVPPWPDAKLALPKPTETPLDVTPSQSFSNETAVIGGNILGRWATDVSYCAASGTNATFLITQKRAETSGGACEFNSVKREGTGVRIAAICKDVSGAKIRNIRLSTAGNNLTWSSESGTSVFVRCGSN